MVSLSNFFDRTNRGLGRRAPESNACSTSIFCSTVHAADPSTGSSCARADVAKRATAAISSRLRPHELPGAHVPGLLQPHDVATDRTAETAERDLREGIQLFDATDRDARRGARRAGEVDVHLAAAEDHALDAARAPAAVLVAIPRGSGPVRARAASTRSPVTQEALGVSTMSGERIAFEQRGLAPQDVEIRAAVVQ